jgi:hypothetical protein
MPHDRNGLFPGKQATVSRGCVIWWLALIVLVLACAGAVVLTTWAYQGEGRIIQHLASNMHSDVDHLRKAGVADGEKMDCELAFAWKNWLVDHGILGDGLQATVILFSCLAMFLLATCLRPRKGGRDDIRK